MGVSKSTEMTIRNPLQQELRKHGVTVVPEFSVSTPAEPSRREHYNLKQDNVTIIDRAKKIFASSTYTTGSHGGDLSVKDPVYKRYRYCVDNIEKAIRQLGPDYIVDLQGNFKDWPLRITIERKEG